MTPRPIATHPRWRRLAARAALLSGAAVVGTYIASHAPREQTLVFRPGSVPAASLTATWTPDGDDQPVGGVTLHFPSPTTRETRHRVSLPNGEYTLNIKLTAAPDRDSNPDESAAMGALPPRAETTVVERVRLEGGETLIALDRKARD
jgi:hypothetical protein